MSGSMRAASSPALGLASTDRALAFTTSFFLVVLPSASWIAGRLIALVLAAALVAWQLARERSPDIEAPPGSVLAMVAIWCAWSVASAAWSVDPAFSLGEVKHDVVASVVAFLVFHYAAQRLPDLHGWMVGFLAGMLVLLVHVALFIATRGWNAYHWQGGPAPFSTHLVLWFVALVPLLLWSGLDARKRALLAFGLLVVCSFATVTLNRSVWLAFGVALLVIGAFGTQRPWSRRTRILWSLAVLVLIAAFAVSLTAKQRELIPPGSDETFGELLLQDDRLKLWGYAIQRIAERVWLGYGFGRAILADAFLDHFAADPRVAVLWHPHNMFVATLLQTGVIGLAVQLALLGTLLAAFGQLARSQAPGRLIGAAGIALVLSVIVKNQTDDTIVRHNALLFWALCGIGLGLGARLKRAAAPSPGTTLRQR